MHAHFYLHLDICLMCEEIFAVVFLPLDKSVCVVGILRKNRGYTLFPSPDSLAICSKYSSALLSEANYEPPSKGLIIGIIASSSCALHVRTCPNSDRRTKPRSQIEHICDVILTKASHIIDSKASKQNGSKAAKCQTKKRWKG